MTDYDYIELEEAISEATDKKTLMKLADILKKYPNDTDKTDLMRNLATRLTMYS
jgi:hypothetical protein